MSEKLSRKDLAKHFGVTPERIRQHIEAGGLVEEQVTGQGWVIDLAKAEAFFETLSPDHVARDRTGKQMRGAGGEVDESALRVGKIYNLARARTAKVKADLAEIELKERRGSVVNKGVVEQQAYTIGKMLLQAFTMMPEKLAAELAILSDPGEVKDRLEAEIAVIVADTEDSLAKLGVVDDGGE